VKIYCIENKLNGKKYVGLTKGKLERRYKSHKDICRSNKAKKYHIHKAMALYGIQNFICYELDVATTYKELCEKEKEWIKKLNTKIDGYNETDGGEGTIGHQHTDKVKQKLSEKAKNQWAILDDVEKNKRINQFNSSKIGNQNAKGKTWNLSKEAKEKISKSKKGIPKSEESKKLLSKMRKGKNNPSFGSFWITNDIDTKKIKSDSLMPEGWRLGRAFKTRKKKE
jgi:group I intron endonuclease